ncbi:hypothetical protein AB4Z09_26450 [Rhodococcus sp. TAF43]|uniref:hypothetical protein n=1 Tax=unclassified Rhodococcus (in: high G+C Gram-positive bacteria) TaxID=192944 RepID=UPI0015826BE3|nr:hypothetical protein [Rhodococcus sp. W8901]QKT09525.1 hypothetical protein HUN07_01155 [Rhodococcus sp. W8901]
MSIPVSLSMPTLPSRNSAPQPLVAGLLLRRRDTAVPAVVRDAVTTGPQIVAASILTAAAGTDADAGAVVIDLDIDPDELAGAVEHRALRYHVTCTTEQVEDAIRLRLPAPVTVFVTASDPSDPEAADAASLAESAQLLADAGHSPGLIAGSPADVVADFLAVLAHTSVGFVGRARDGAEVLALLSGTVAALRGDDVRAALSAPDPAALAALIPEAAEAVRGVLLGIEVDDPDQIEGVLADAGLL